MASKKTQIDFHRAVRAEIYDIALKRGIAQNKADVAKRMIAMGFDTSEIHKITGLSESEIEDLRNA